MKMIKNLRYFLAVIVLLGNMSLAGVCIAEDQASNDPAQDPIYLKLKDKDVNSMTSREYDLYKQKEAAVTQYRNQQVTAKAIDNSTSRATWMTAVFRCCSATFLSLSSSTLCFTAEIIPKLSC